MINFCDTRNVNCELSLSTFTPDLQLVSMQKGKQCYQIIIDNLIVFQMQYEHESWTDNSF